MTKNIFIITSNFPPANIVGALRPYRLARHISSRGWKPIIITFLPDHKSALDFSLLDNLDPGTEICYINKDLSKDYFVNIIELKKIIKESVNSKRINKSKKRTFITRFKNLCRRKLGSWMRPDPDVIWSFSIARRILSRIDLAEENIILTTSPPHSLHVTGLLLSRLKNIPWVVDFRDPWDAYPFTGSYDLINPISKFLEKNILRHADAVISTTDTATRLLCERHSDIDSEKFKTITNSFDEKLMDMASERNRDYFIISYTGIFYPEKDPYVFFRALRSWIDSMSKDNIKKYINRLKVKLIGSGDATTRDVIKRLQLKDIVEFVDRIAHTEAIKLTKESDMVLISTGLGNKTRPGWLPSKLFEYLGCRIPILAIIREGEMAGILRESNAGYVITSEDHKSIHGILEAEINKKFMPNKITQGAHDFTFDNIERFEEKNVFENMINIIENVLKSKSDKIS